ncbi:unnamed protein product [Orchesella dallaii]|uniref:Uncharacterized protein n=1 Tax=Orchesella dallaii TaxID=48710 RepID=A0ABP1QPC4_9HEXA
MRAFTALLFLAIVGLALATIDAPKNKTQINAPKNKTEEQDVQTHPSPPPLHPTGLRDARFLGLFGGYGLGYGSFPYYGGYIGYGGYSYPYGKLLLKSGYLTDL